MAGSPTPQRITSALAEIVRDRSITKAGRELAQQALADAYELWPSSIVPELTSEQAAALAYLDGFLESQVRSCRNQKQHFLANGTANVRERLHGAFPYLAELPAMSPAPEGSNGH